MPDNPEGETSCPGETDPAAPGAQEAAGFIGPLSPTARYLGVTSPSAGPRCAVAGIPRDPGEGSCHVGKR
jgi:hypothetical protein